MTGSYAPRLLAPLHVTSLGEEHWEIAVVKGPVTVGYLIVRLRDDGRAVSEWRPVHLRLDG